jgi:hypothetical protein
LWRSLTDGREPAPRPIPSTDGRRSPHPP